MEKSKLLILILVILLAFGISFYLTLNTTDQENIAGQAYSYSQQQCVFCEEYCGNTHSKTGGIIASTSEIRIKALSEGCQGEELQWISPNIDAVLCCK